MVEDIFFLLLDATLNIPLFNHQQFALLLRAPHERVPRHKHLSPRSTRCLIPLFSLEPPMDADDINVFAVEDAVREVFEPIERLES